MSSNKESLTTMAKVKKANPNTSQTSEVGVPHKKKSERILTFDILRGYFLFVILINHLYFYPSGLEILTGRSALLTSTAEGFFVISGIMLGLVRGRKLIDKPFKVPAKMILKRSLQLYVTSVILTILFTFIGYLFLNNPGLKTTIWHTPSDVWSMIWQALTLQYTYGWADFLRLYAIFIFFAPVALWLLRKGLWYILLAVSAYIWSLYFKFPPESAFAQVASWQFIFFGGFIVGFYWDMLLEKWRALSIKARKTIGITLSVVFAATLIASFVLTFGKYLGGDIGASIDTMNRTVNNHFDKNRLSLPRMIIGTVWLWGLIYIVRRLESTIKKHLGWFLLEWGMNSLYVYTISAFVVFFVHLIVAPTPNSGLESIPFNLGMSILVTAIVHIILKKRILANIIPK